MNQPNEITPAHRELGRGRKAFWVVVWVAVVIGVAWATWTPRQQAPALTVASVDSTLELSSAIWSGLTPEQKSELVDQWNALRSRTWR